MMANDARCTREIKCSIAMAKAAFNNKKTLYQQIGLHFKEGKVNQSHYRPEVPRGFQEVKVPRLRDSDSG
jgi:hypothetical protein